MNESKSKMKITPNNLLVLEQNYYQAAFNNEDGRSTVSNHLPLEVCVYQNRFYLSDGHHRLNERHEEDMPPLVINFNFQKSKPIAGDDKFVPLTQIYRNYYQSEPPPLKWREHVSLSDQLESKRAKINRNYWQAGFRLGCETEAIIKEMAVFAPKVFIYNRPKLPVLMWELADKYLYAFSFFQALLVKEVWKDKNVKSGNLLCYHGNYDIGAVKRFLARQELFEVEDLCKGQQRFYSLKEKF